MFRHNVSFDSDHRYTNLHIQTQLFPLSPRLDLSANTLCLIGLYSQGLLYGGPVVLIWSWVFTGAVTILVGLAMSELSSAFPVSGGLYFWSFMLAGKYGPVASWCVGWINLLGQVGHRRLFCCSLLNQRFLQLQACGWTLCRLLLWQATPTRLSKC